MQPQRRRQLIVTALLILALQWLPLFDVVWWLRPASVEQWRCQTAEALRAEHGLAEGFIGFSGHPHGPLWLYSTTVVREVVCTAAESGREWRLSYRDVYLNVSHHDVQGEMARLSVLFPLNQAYDAWRYDRETLLWLLGHAHRPDRHGLVLEQLQQDTHDWTHWALWCWLQLIVVALAITLSVTLVPVKQEWGEI